MTELIENYWVFFLVGQYPNGPLGGLALTMRGPRPRVEPWAPLREPVGECRDADVCSSLRVLSEGWPRRGPLVVAKKRYK